MTSNATSPSQRPHSPSADSSGMSRGRVCFVGAGPGAADLLTVRAKQLLEAADVVLYDVLVPPHLLGTLRPEVEQIPVSRDDPSTGRRLGDPGRAVGKLLAHHAHQGGLVVRLKGGDPTVFARLAEELAPLQEAGIGYEIVPGVTAATAAAAAISAPLTSRFFSSSVTLVTGHRAGHQPADDHGHDDTSGDCGAAGDPQGQEEFARLAALPGTLVVYMGLETIDQWTASLLAAGFDGKTPAAVISRCTWPDERRCTTTLEGLRSNTSLRSWPSPAVIIVGQAIRPALPSPAPSSVPQPLAGQRVLVTRPTAQAVDMLTLLSRKGAVGLCVPVVEIVPPPSWEPIDEAIQQASLFDWIVFSSSNGVEAFADRLSEAGDARLLGTARLAAVGPRTAETLAKHRLSCDLVPTTYSAAGLVEAFAGEPKKRRFLLVQADRGRDTLENQLTALGHEVCRVTAYISRDVAQLDEATAGLLHSLPVDWVVLSSPAIAASAIRLFGERLQGWKTACNSQAAADLLEANGIRVTVTSSSPAMVAVVEAMQAWEMARAGHESHT